MVLVRIIPETETILLDVNYRSSRNIVNGALRVISNNSRRYKKKLVTSGDKGACIHVQEVKDAKEESKYLIDKIREAEKEGIPHSDMAVLYRTANDAESDDGDFAGISDSIPGERIHSEYFTIILLQEI